MAMATTTIAYGVRPVGMALFWIVVMVLARIRRAVAVPAILAASCRVNRSDNVASAVVVSVETTRTVRPRTVIGVTVLPDTDGARVVLMAPIRAMYVGFGVTDVSGQVGTADRCASRVFVLAGGAMHVGVRVASVVVVVVIAEFAMCP